MNYTDVSPVAVAALPPKRSSPRMLEVVSSERVTPRMMRVHLGGPELSGFPAGREGAHIKLLLPRPGQARPELPTLGEHGPIWPNDADRPIARTYSVRRHDLDANVLSVDFVLHGDDGPAARWAAAARPGDAVGLAGPGGPNPMLASADWYLLAGDMAALPALGALLETLPASARGRAIIQVSGRDETQALDYTADIAITWIYPGAPAGSASLIDAIRAVRWPQRRCFAWVAGENATVVAARRHLRQQGFDKRSLYTVPYWKATLAEEAYHQERHRIMDAHDND